jgi:RHS repeat-associated protein
MADGRVLLLGGEGSTGPAATAFLLDPKTGSVTQLPNGLQNARSWHTATMLPNGTVLILGGIGAKEKIEKTAEVFDPSSGTFQSVQTSGIKARSSHTATLLTDGRVLLAGGADESGKTVGALEVWDFRSGQSTTLATMQTPRSKHTATLLADGTVLFYGGVSAIGVSLDYGEIFDPITEALRMQATPILPQIDPHPPQLAQSVPSDGATDTKIDALIALRFSKPLNVMTIVSGVSLSGPQGAVEAKTVPAEGGTLAFVNPAQTLDQGTSYTLSLSGLADNSGQSLPDQTIQFTTASSQNDDTGSGVGVVGNGAGGNSGSSSDPLNSPFRNLPPLHAKPGVTALAGQVLTLDGTPLSKVTLEVEGGSSAETDGSGRFLLQPLTAGHHTMWIDGGTANTKDVTFGLFEVGIDIDAAKTNVLKYTIWMPALDMSHAVTIPSPTQTETVVTTPALPGLELHLPPQTTVTDRNGKPVTQLSITPIPVKQPPFPLPKDVLVPLYFTIQPGGAYIQVANANGPQGAQLYYPNAYHFPSAAVFNFYNYDADNKGWYVYGQGKVSADRSQVVPNPGVTIYEFTGAMVSNPGNAPFKGRQPGNPSDGDPVDLQTGLFIYRKNDLVLPDVIPLVLTRTYRPDDYISRAFGIGTSHPYDIFMVGDNNGGPGIFPEGYTYQDLILADGSRIHFTRTSPCTGTNGYCDFTNAVYTALSSPTDFYGATIQWNTCGFTGAGAAWCLKKKDGTTYAFPDSDNSTNPRAAAPVGMRDRYGNTLTFTRDVNHNLTQITSPNGRYIKFTLDSSNRITLAQDNIGRMVQYAYDSAGRLVQVTDANSGVWKYTYDSNNNMITIQDPLGIVYLTGLYDVNNRVIGQVSADGGSYGFSSSSDQNGNVTGATVNDPRGNTKQFTFNSDGYVTSATFAVGKPEQQTITYNRLLGSNFIQSITDALGRTTSFTYDNMGNMTSVTKLSGTVNAVTTQFAYDPTFNQLTAATDPLGHTTSFILDNVGNVINIVDPIGNTKSFTYNSQGQPTSVTDAAGNMTQMTYDSGDLIAVTDPLGRTVTRLVDAAGRLISTTDALGHITKYVYNALNEVTSITDAKGNSTNLAYDLDGNLLSVTDASSHTTQYTYDSMNRLQTRKDALLNQECYGTVSAGVCQANGYDANGNLIQFTDRRGKVSKFNYDGLGRRTFAGYGWTTGSTYESTVSFAYDAGNRLTQAVDSLSGTITRGYDGMDRLISDATPQGTVSYTYDNAGRTASLTVPGQTVVSYSFDNSNRLTQIAQGTTAVGFTYDMANRRSSLILPNGIVTNYSYDSASRLMGLAYALGTNTLGNLSYTYDLNGRRISTNGSFARTGLPLAVNQTAYNANNQLTQWGTANLFYDLNGNMTSDGTHIYSWNSRNRLVSIDSGNTASFAYDPFGRRTSKTISGTQTGLLYDGVNPIQELSGTTPTANLLAGGVDEYFMRTDSSGARNFLADPQGSTIALTDSTGTVQTSYTFEPFGSTTTVGPSTTNSLAYTGRELDGTGLYFYRARYYSPTFQRFMSEDPAEFNGGSTNVYTYTSNNPVNLRDPGGENPACLIGGLLGTMGYNGSVIVRSLFGRKASYYAGFKGLGRILGGNLESFAIGCAAGTLIAPLGFSVPANAGVVYGGGEFFAARAAAESAVAASEGALATISDTLGGQAAEYLTSGAPSWISDWVWDYASAEFAGGLEGTVTVFEGSFGAAGEFAAQSDLISVELPILRQAVIDGIVNLVQIAVP